MSELAEKAAEVTAEVVEDAIDGVVETLEVYRTNPVLLASAWLGGLGIGAGVGYFVAVRRLKAHFEEIATQEILEAKEFYAALNKVDVETGEPLSPMEVLERSDPKAAALLREYQGGEDTGARDDAEAEEDEKLLAKAETRAMERAKLHSLSIDAEVGPGGGKIVSVEETTVNIFEDDTFDYEEEVKHRTEEKPYVITHDEFYEAGEKNYEHASLTYFTVDQVLVDERDQPVEQVEQQIGTDHLARFGSGSRDPNIVFVRNDRLGIDYEITRSTGSYLEEVLGMGSGDE